MCVGGGGGGGAGMNKVYCYCCYCYAMLVPSFPTHKSHKNNLDSKEVGSQCKDTYILSTLFFQRCVWGGGGGGGADTVRGGVYIHVLTLNLCNMSDKPTKIPSKFLMISIQQMEEWLDELKSVRDGGTSGWLNR